MRDSLNMQIYFSVNQEHDPFPRRIGFPSSLLEAPDLDSLCDRPVTRRSSIHILHSSFSEIVLRIMIQTQKEGMARPHEISSGMMCLCLKMREISSSIIFASLFIQIFIPEMQSRYSYGLSTLGIHSEFVA